MMDVVLKNISLLLCPQHDHIERKRNVHIGVKENRIAYIGSDQPHADTVIDASQLIVLPGLIDPHTHAVWGGSRAQEFARRLAGKPYSEILEEGGGILSTVRETRKRTETELHRIAAQRIRAMQRQGVTRVEIKSGYGLSTQHEEKILSVANNLKEKISVSTTFLGAHTIPKEFRKHRDRYVAEIIEEQLPRCAPLAEFIDVYCDRGAFTLDESIAILKAGKKYGLRIKAHAEQVTHTGIAAAAAKLGAISVEHLEYAQSEDIAAMKDHGTIAVLLPGAQLYLKDRSPPVHAFREAGVPMAIGTDLNPGTSPVFNIWTCATLSCILQGLTMEEALLGMTINAAKAVGQEHEGIIVEGGLANLAIFQPPPGDPIELESLMQSMGHASCRATIQNGKIVFHNLADRIVGY